MDTLIWIGIGVMLVLYYLFKPLRVKGKVEFGKISILFIIFILILNFIKGHFNIIEATEPIFEKYTFGIEYKCGCIFEYNNMHSCNPSYGPFLWPKFYFHWS